MDNGEQKMEKKGHINPFLFMIPALFDILASTLMLVALTTVSASVYQMMSGSMVIITSVLSVIFLKRKQYAHHILSLMIICVGLTLVAYTSKINQEAD